MEIKRAAIKKNAKLLIATTRPSPILVFLVYILIGLVLLYLSESISGETKMVQEMLLQYQAGNLEYVPEPPELSGWACVLLIALSVMNYMLAVGTHIYSLEICQQRQGSFGNLFDGFGIFGKSLLLAILETIFIYLWTLLLIVPGIIAIYRYRMALYVMIDHPELGPLDCLRESKRLMTGHKWELFVLDLSFLGWFLLCLLPPASVWVEPYTRITYTNYYLALRDMPGSSFNTTV